MWHKIEFWATTRSTHIWFSCTMSYVTFLPSLENAQCNTSKYIYFIFCGETFLLMKDKKPREYFKLSFIVPVAISKTHFQHKSDWYNYLTSYIVPFCSSYAKFLQDSTGNYSFTFSFKGYILIYGKHSHFLQKQKTKKKTMRADDGEGSWETWAIWEFSLCATHPFWWGCETISLEGANRSACSRFSQLGCWKPGCKSPGNAAETLTHGWWSLLPPLWWETGLATQMLQGRRSRYLWMVSHQLCCTLLPCSLQLSDKGGMFWKKWLWWYKPPLAAPFTAGVKSHCRQTQPPRERGVQGPHNLGLGQRSWLL